MSNKAIDRLAYLKSEYTDIRLIEVTDDCQSYTEYVVDRNGDILTFRVYGKGDDMFITEK